MGTGDFFRETTDQSRIKTRIVSKYFVAWAKIMVSAINDKGSDRLAFIDLFAGPGRYENDLPSTPLHILGSAAKDPKLRETLVSIFNDVRPEYASSLKKTLDAHTEFQQLKYRPQVYNYQVGEALVEHLEQIQLVPTLLFVDPWGYKGLSLRLIDSVLKDWGSDCIIFFNYNRINSGLNNESVKAHMEALFGTERAKKLREQLPLLSPRSRERTILNEIAEAFRVMEGRYFLPFRFWSETQERISHHLLFVSKNFRGYHLMKEIMAKESSSEEQSVPSFEYNPRDFSLQRLELYRPLEELKEQLLNDFAGRTLSMNDVYEEHSINKPFLKSNYKQALWNLYTESEITTSRKPRKNTFADNINASFPLQ